MPPRPRRRAPAGLGYGETGQLLADRPTQSAADQRQRATAGLRAFRARGGKIRTQTWYRLYNSDEIQATEAFTTYRTRGGTMRAGTFYRAWGQAELEGMVNHPEVLAPLHRRPTTFTTMQTRSATGIMQRIRIFATDDKGNVHVRDASVTSSQGMSRNNAIREAIEISSAPDKRHTGSDLRHLHTIAAFHFAAITMTPR